jgi:hypothetical protein
VLSSSWLTLARSGIPGWPGLGEGGQFAGEVVGFGRADPLEDLQCLPQEGFCLGDLAGGQGAAAQARPARR